MITDKILRFDKKQKYRVKFKLSSKGEEYSGKLTVGKNLLPRLTTDNFGFFVTNNTKEFRRIYCSTGISNFTLFNCEAHGDYLYPEYIYAERINSRKFSEFEIYYSNISKWLSTAGYIKYENNHTRLVKDIGGKEFSVKVKYKTNHEIVISNKYRTRTSSKDDGSVKIVEDIAIHVESKTHYFEPEDISQISRDICKIFSLLAYHPISIEKIKAIPLFGKKTYRNFYFPFSNTVEKSKLNRNYAFSRAEFFYEHDLWERIFRNFYENQSVNQNFSHIWSRLHSLMNYPGFWDYELLGVFSIVDAYSDFFYGQQPKNEISRSSMRKIKSHLRSALDEVSSDVIADDAIIDSLHDSIQSLRRSKHFDFSDKYDLLLSSIPETVVKIINIKDEHITHFKGLRNRIAHGQPIKTKVPRNYTHENIIKNKIILLLMYLMFREIGLTEEHFLRCLKRNISSLVQNSYINTTLLDKHLKTTKFIKLNIKDFNITKKTRLEIIGLILEEFPKGKFKPNLEAMEYCNSKISLARKYKHLSYLVEEYFTNQKIKVSVKYEGSIYISNSKGEDHHIHQAFTYKRISP